MRKISLFAALVVAMGAVSCVQDINDGTPVNNDGAKTFEATFDAAASKAVLKPGVDESKVEWEAGDQVSVLAGEGNYLYTAASSGASTTLNTEATDVPSEGTFYAVYPYDNAAALADGKISTTLPAEQTAVLGSFSTHLAVAQTTGSTLAFKNVCGLVKVTVDADNVTKVVFEGNSSEVVAGGINVTVSDTPSWEAVAEQGATSVALVPAEGQTTLAKGAYYFAVLPQKFDAGFKVTAYKGSDASVIRNVATEYTLERADIMGGRAFGIDGTGSETDPYILKTAQDLVDMNSLVPASATAYFKMANDIDMAGVTNFVPVDPSGNKSIYFDGDGHIIKNFYHKGQTYPSFFGVLRGSVKNVGFYNARVEVEGGPFAGILAGYVGMKNGTAYGAAGTATVENVYVHGSVEGGICGGISGALGKYSVIKNSYSVVDVCSINQAGGIAASVYDYSKIENCYAAGIVQSIGEKKTIGDLGGLANANAEFTNSVSYVPYLLGYTVKRGVGNPNNATKITNVKILDSTIGMNMTEGPEGCTSGDKAALTSVITELGAPWSTTLNCGYPLLAWQVTRGDYAEFAGHRTAELPKFAGGDGTENSPYLISSLQHLVNVDSALKEGSKVYFKLTSDINFNNSLKWAPIDDVAPWREIDFNGNGKKITKFLADAGNYKGLFGVLYGNCYDLTIENATINGGSTLGILAGYVGTGGCPASVRNVTVSGTVTATGGTVGGLAGRTREGSFENCHADVTVTIKGKQYGGGLLGVITNTVKVPVKNCSATGVIDVQESTDKTIYNYGGLIGGIENCSAEIEGCHASVSISGNRLGQCGGFMGHITNVNSEVVSIKRCYATGNVTSTANGCGGFLGYIKMSYTQSSSLTIEDCYSTGNVAAGKSQRHGGFIGGVECNTTIARCFSTGSVSSGPCVGGFIGYARYLQDYKVDWGTDIKVSVTNSISWSPEVKSTAQSGQWSASPLIGASASSNTYTNLYYNPAVSMTDPYFQVGYEHPDVNASSPITIGNANFPGVGDYVTNYGGPTAAAYYGHKAAADATVTTVARDVLGWSSDIWDFSKDIPTLK